MLKRYEGLPWKEMMAKQAADLKSGKVKRVTFWVERNLYERKTNNPNENYDFSEFSISDKDPNLISLQKLYLTKKLDKVNELAYLQYHDFDIYNLAKYITVNDEIIYGVPVQNLVRAHKLYMKHKQVIDELENKDKLERKQKLKEWEDNKERYPLAPRP